jgi:hypothetical protein
MMTTTHPLAEDYLRRLNHIARVLPRHERDELVAEIRNHLDSGLPPDATDADVRNLLDQLGPPNDIVAAARPEHPPMRRGPREVFALILLVTGFPPILGWLAGVGLLLWSPLWSTRQKLLAILVWPGGYCLLLGLGTPLIPLSEARSCPLPPGAASEIPIGCTSSGGPSPWWIVATVIFAVAPLLVAAHLYRAAGRRAEAA